MPTTICGITPNSRLMIQWAITMGMSLPPAALKPP